MKKNKGNFIIENKFKNNLYKLLKKDARLWDEKKEFSETLLKDLIDKMDEKIIELLLGDKETKGKFFIKIKNARLPDGQVFVLKQNDLKFFIDENKLDNSYTQYQNKIGLRFGHKLLSERDEVVLDWPFKDCVLEGGMTKEDQKRNEIFFNEVLAKDEIDRLFDPKAFTNFKRIDKDGEYSLFPPLKKGDEGGFRRDENGMIKDNLIIKGNNLLALHSLKEQFAGKIKLIYIDPPYNTGNDGFKYNDSFNHSSWLVFMKNRLEIAKQLLRDDGVIFISIDENEHAYLKVMTDEIFGRENFITSLVWYGKYTTSNDAKYVSTQHENILFYAKNKSNFSIGLLNRTEKMDEAYKNLDNDPRGQWKATPLHAKSGTEKGKYKFIFKNGIEWLAPAGRFPRFSIDTLKRMDQENRIYFGKDGKAIPNAKTFLSEVKQGKVVGSVWSFDEVGSTHKANEELAELFGKGIFDNPKVVGLIKQILKVGNTKNDIILDFFAGSGTTAHAVLELNKEDGGNRQFILCEQMHHVDTVTKERVKKVIENNKVGDFVYLELAKWNEEAKEKILKTKNLSALEKLFDELYERYFLNYNLEIKKFKESIKEEEFKKLGLDKQKKLFVEMLDMNQMYVNFSERADKKYNLSKEDIALSEEFYSPR